MRGWSSPVAKAFTAIPLAATGLPPAGQPLAVAMLTVGIQERSGAGSAGEGPKLRSAAAGVEGSLQAASGSASAPTDIASKTFLRIVTPLHINYNAESRPMFAASALKFV